MRDHEYLDLAIIPKFNLCAFRYFLPHEHHITRVCKDDVLLMVFDGVLRFEEDGREVDLCKGQWYIQHAGGYQTGLRESDSPSYFYVHFFATYTQNRHNVLPLSGAFDPQHFLPMMKALDQCSDYPHGQLDHYIHFLRILTRLSDQEKNVSSGSSLCVEVAEYIDRHYTERVSLTGIEREFSYSKDHIIRIFKLFYGVTPYQYMTLQRISQAKKLMTSTNHVISDIARACGYNDMTTFYRAFVHQTGESPSLWRDNAIGKSRLQKQAAQREEE